MHKGPINFETLSSTLELSHLGIAFQTSFHDYDRVEQFKNPPIQEALLDTQVPLPPDLKLETLKKFHEGLEARFPEKQERISWEQGFQISGAGETHAILSSRSV